MVETGGLENRLALTGYGGSNPSPSAKLLILKNLYEIAGSKPLFTGRCSLICRIGTLEKSALVTESRLIGESSRNAENGEFSAETRTSWDVLAKSDNFHFRELPRMVAADCF